jgi:hypothetical protein
MQAMIAIRAEERRRARTFPRGFKAHGVVIIVATLLVAGCTTVRVTPTERSSVE